MGGKGEGRGVKGEGGKEEEEGRHGDGGVAK